MKNGVQNTYWPKLVSGSPVSRPKQGLLPVPGVTLLHARVQALVALGMHVSFPPAAQAVDCHCSRLSNDGKLISTRSSS